MIRTLSILAYLAATPALAGDVEIVGAEAQPGSNGWRFAVTLKHGDTGWSHYADAWEIRLADGTVLGTRVLAHPHENEQPFTRTLSGVAIPESVTEVVVHARDKTHGWSPQTLTLRLR